MPPSLPDGFSGNLVLATASHDEQIQARTASHALFGAGSTLNQFIEHQLSTYLGHNGDVASWILTNSKSESKPRLLLSACQTIRKRALYRDPSTGDVTEVFAHALSAVFTPLDARRCGYAGRMTSLISEELARQHEMNPESAQFSYLYSAIGPEFYAQNGGWRPVAENAHIEIEVLNVNGLEESGKANVVDVTDDVLPTLLARDAELLRAQIALPYDGDPRRVKVAFCPDPALFQSIYMSEDRMLSDYLGKAPTVRGAVYTSSSGTRVWALWRRTRYRAREDGTPEKYRLHFLRLVVEDRSKLSEEELVEGLRGVFAVAMREAKIWNCDTVDTWNPSPDICDLVQERIAELRAKLVAREQGDVACLLWLGHGSDGRDIDWVANERYAWC